ncbi:MAG: efflux RND transporter periplasmic adaptor subunit [Opitutaceae bacterium]|nr:efflux RND transporter periplasmic adaptor subunit [Opitutaceae bacterium]
MSASTTSPLLRRLRRRPLLIASGLLLTASVGLYSFTASRGVAAEPTAAVPPPAPKVTVSPVEVKLVTEFEEITGRIDATETVELRARVSGHLDSIHFQAGQLVKKGDLLFTIDPRWYQAQFDLANARAGVAVREAKRAQDLLAAAAISSEEAESRRAKAAEAQAELVAARLDLEHTEVRAPIDGRVHRAFVTAGNLVSGAPGNATALTTIVSTGAAFVYADLDENTLLKFNRSARDHHLLTEAGRVPVTMQLADELDYPRHGYIDSMDNRVNPSTGTLTVRMLFPNEDGALVPGLFARVRLPVGAPQTTLLVSERAIGTDQSQKFVLTVSTDNTVAYRTVKLGGAISGKRVIRQGLNPGDSIIVNGLQRVRPGMTVAPEPEMAAGPLPSSTSAGSKLASTR